MDTCVSARTAAASAATGVRSSAGSPGHPDPGATEAARSCPATPDPTAAPPAESPGHPDPGATEAPRSRPATPDPTAAPPAESPGQPDPGATEAPRSCPATPDPTAAPPTGETPDRRRLAMPAPYATARSSPRNPARRRLCALSGTSVAAARVTGSLRDMEFSGPVAAAYAEHRRGYPAPVVDLLVDALGLPRDASVLDLGCGTGQLTVPLAGRYDRVIGADPCPDMLALARSRSGGAPVAWLLADDREVIRLPLLTDLDAMTVAQAIHLVDRLPLFTALATRMPRRARLAIIANGSPLWLRDLPWSRALNAYLGRWLGTTPRSACGTDADSRARYRAELAATGWRTATEVVLGYQETHSFERIVGNVYSALSPGSLPTDLTFEAGLRDALGPGPFEEDVRVAILVAGR